MQFVVRRALLAFFFAAVAVGCDAALSVAARGEGGENDALPLEPIPADAFAAQLRPLLETYCFHCHAAGDAAGGIDLSAARDDDALRDEGRLWQRVALVLKTRAMPPADDEQPSDDERAAMQRHVETALRNLNCDEARDPGAVTIRRLNRVEYANTIRDLLGVEFDPGEFPEDPRGYGFDNIGDVLFIPPVLFEKYVDATTTMLTQFMNSPEAQARVFIAKPGPQENGEELSAKAAAERVLSRFILRAFRRPASDEELAARLELFERIHARGEPFEAALAYPMKATLLSPFFLFRYEQDAPARGEARAANAGHEAVRLTDYELAARLSYFLWSTMPDDELFELAAQGALQRDDVLRAQTRRMLADPKSIALSENFAAQWLQFREIRSQGIDFRTYQLGGEVREAMYRESLLCFDHLVRENRPITDLLAADYTFLNRPLAEHYGIPDVHGREMRKVALTDANRGGVLGQGAILLATSYPARTSPVQRGKFVLEELLGQPPPPPPPNVGELPNKDERKDDKPPTQTLREQLEIHRTKATCAACHQTMDALGFGLENFDGVGKWRTREADLEIDASGELPDGTKFNGPAELKQVLLAQKEQFARTMTEKMLIYALGRPLEFFDECVLRQTSAALEANDYRLHAMVEEIVCSLPFRHRRAP